MSLDFQFAPIDVDLPTHPRVMDIPRRLRLAALGLYMWAQCYTRRYGTDGRLPRSAVHGACAADERSIPPLAAELVRVGLWLSTDDGYEIFNFEKKSAGRESAAARAKRYRDRKRDEASRVTSRVTPNVTERHVTDVTSCSLSYSPSRSVSSSGEGPGEGPPPWFAVDVVATLAATGVTVDDVPSRWLEYSASRARKAWAMNARDACGWLTTVLRAERARAPAPKSARQPLGDVGELPWVAEGGGSL